MFNWKFGKNGELICLREQVEKLTDRVEALEIEALNKRYIKDKAIKTIKRWASDAKPATKHRKPLVKPFVGAMNLSDIDRAIGKSLGTAMYWRNKYPDTFPKPRVSEQRGPREICWYDGAEVLAYMKDKVNKTL